MGTEVFKYFLYIYFSNCKKNMAKKYFILLMIAFVYTNSFSQKLSIDELRSLNKMSMQDFKTVVKEKYKYSYSDKTESDNFTLFQYSNFENDINRTSGKFRYPNDISQNSVEYTTTDKREFDNLNKELIKLGYKETGKGKIMGGDNYKDYKLNSFVVRMVFPKKN
jgi:hypothetical protein